MSDAELIEQIQKGNTHSFTFLVERYQRLVLHIVARMLTREEDVEDICQDVFVAVFRNLGRFRNESKLSTWIAQIAYNTTLNYLKKIEKDILLYDSPDEYIMPTNEEKLPDKIIETKELKNTLLQEIEKLPIQYRTVVTLFHIEQFSYKEIEEITEIKIGTIKSYLSRARHILKERLIFVLKD